MLAVIPQTAVPAAASPVPPAVLPTPYPARSCPSPDPQDSWQRTFPGTLDQAAAARTFLRALLAGSPYLDDVLLAADELVVNALRHTASGEADGFFTLSVRRTATDLSVSVTDQGSPTEPLVTDADDLAESGRGLRTVTLLAHTWGWHGNRRSRTVTAVFAAT